MGPLLILLLVMAILVGCVAPVQYRTGSLGFGGIVLLILLLLVLGVIHT